MKHQLGFTMKSNLKNSALLLALSLGLTLGITACGEPEEASESKTQSATKTDTTPVEVLSLKSQDFQNKQSFFADAQASQDAQLLTRSGGKVNKVLARNGQWVKKGQNLCDIDAEIHKTNMELAQAQFELAETEYNRLSEYLTKELGSKTQVDQAKVQFLQAKQAKLNTQELYREATCQSPISGKVGMKMIEAHQTLNPGSPTFQIVNSYSLKLVFGIPENLIQEYKAGNLVEIYGGEEVIQAKINTLSATMDPNTRTFLAEVIIKNPKGQPFAIGSSIKIKALGTLYKDQWVIPNKSILNFAESNAVMIVNEGQAKRYPVEILASNGTHSRVAGEFKEGDLLVVANQHRLIDGSHVKMIEAPQQETK